MSYIGLIGSKTTVSADLIKRMPREAFGKCCIELFAGGSGVFFAKRPAKINVLNDLDPDIVLMHEMVKRDHKAVEAELRTFLDDDLLFQECLRLRESVEWEAVPPARRAAMVIYILKQSVNSNQQVLSSSSQSGSSFNPNLSLEEYATKLARAQIRHFGYEKCIDVYLYRSPEVEAFIFADPPYVVSTKAMHYRYNFHAIEHIRFWFRMHRLNQDNGPKRNVKIMITYDDDPLIRALYREEHGWHISTLKIGYNSAHDAERSRDEIVICNFLLEGSSKC